MAASEEKTPLSRGGFYYWDPVALARAMPTLEATVEVPAGSAPTWAVELPVGEHAVVAANPDGTAVTALGVLAVR